MSQSGRYRIIDSLKGICCIAVVLIHYNFSGNLGIVTKSLMTFAVPYFFFVSGFFMPDDNNVVYRQRTWRKLRHIFSLITFATVVYTIFYAYLV